MAGHTRAPKVELFRVHRAIVMSASRETRGPAPELAKAASHDRKAPGLAFAAARPAQRWDHCAEGVMTVVPLAVARMSGGGFRLDAGYFRWESKGLDVSRVRVVPRWHHRDPSSLLKRDAPARVGARTAASPGVTDGLSARLLAALRTSMFVGPRTVIAPASLATQGGIALDTSSTGSFNEWVVSARAVIRP